MLLDALTRVANSQTFNGASEVSESSIDLAGFVPSAPSTPLSPARRVGSGEPMVAVFVVETAAAATGTGEVYTLEVIDAADAVLTSTPAQLAAINRTEAQLAAGTIHLVDIPVGQGTQRFLGARVDLPLSASTVVLSIYIVPRSFVDAWLAYARNYTV